MLNDSWKSEISTPSRSEEWRILAEKASRETDSKELIALVERLCEVLDSEKQQRGEPVPAKPDQLN